MCAFRDTRFYQVRDGLLLQFRTRDVAREKPTGWFKLADIHAQAADPTVPVFGVAPEDRACVIELRSAKRLVLLRAPTHEEVRGWRGAMPQSLLVPVSPPLCVTSLRRRGRILPSLAGDGLAERLASHR